MERKKTLLEKYDIPLNHLDFAYIAECKHAREMEKIVQILRSGEEGYYPDLTRCAEEKLRELKPDSRLFRYEQPIPGRDSLPSSEWKPIYDWTHDIKNKDEQLKALQIPSENAEESKKTEELDCPPVRTSGKIVQESDTETIATLPKAAPTSAKRNETPVAATDYRKWDKYDADVEILRMDLDEERVQEEVERKNRINLQKTMQAGNTFETPKDSQRSSLWKDRLNDIEKQKLAEEYRIRGNEYYRVMEYDKALREYDHSIETFPDTAAAAYNNRAITNIKLQKYAPAIADCKSCLKLEPYNLKARLRLAKATHANGNAREAYELYNDVLKLDPTNEEALKATTEIVSLLGELPPANATRIQIEDNAANPAAKAAQASSKKATAKQTTAPTAAKEPPKPVDYDYADLIVPNRVVKSKMAAAAEALGSLKIANNQNQPQESQQIPRNAPPPKNDRKTEHEPEPELELKLPTFGTATTNTKRKLLIEEL